FNISILYNEDADIVHHFYAFQCEVNHRYKPKNNLNYITQKTGNVLWMVSNCNFTSGREYYVREMQKYIDVDIYGECGNGNVCGEYKELRQDCVQQFIGKYKFYLSFENSFCDDYYTEKISKLIGVDTIPVVMGLTNYTAILTPGTFIDVRDFSSVKSLTDYLTYLQKNNTAFHEIIERRR
ncbi:hypothetical protein CAPTEDRAFT_76756, partial [Capitella teleta]